ncbi:hypothetical protein [Shewanella sp. YLB-07]|uniref:hypothetical protein n=1 Tax=Shewanella sp. YLB-07 TaxID=2601268 RepID=UPI00128C6198|nr:hypothetical protein [Shewanella sp. YLB-07]MPY21164.1 hypothetical protein [Shewanella sp. YLB-07]MPY21951.1 hypothetical protein [Shewanella sp. YLB-07]
MTFFRLVALVLVAVFLSGCQEDVTFQVDTVTEFRVDFSDTHKGLVSEGEIEDAVTACYLRVYAINHLDYGIKIGPQIKVNNHGVEHTLSIDSWGDDWEYLVAGKDGEEYKQKLCFKEEALNPISCAELADAIKNKAYKLELNRCEKIDQSPASCNMGIGVVQGGINFRSIGANEMDSTRLAD